MHAGIESEHSPMGGDEVEHNSRLEPLIIQYLCVPVLERIPRSVAPNTLSLFNHLVCWLVFMLAAWSQSAPWGLRSAILGLAAFGVFSTMLLDCLDGMQARRTQQASKLGELVDHGLDTINVPLLGSSLALALQVEGWPLVLVAVATSAVYHAQLVVFHESGRFVHGSTSGTEGQLLVSAAFLVLAATFFFFPAEARWLRAATYASIAVFLVIDLRVCLFYYARLSRFPWGHLFFLTVASGFGLLYLLGTIGAVSLLLLVTLASFRLSGGYVLRTLIGRPWNGLDLSAVAALLCVFAGGQLDLHAAPLDLSTLSVIGASFLLVARALWELTRELPLLRQGRRAAAVPRAAV